MEGFIDRANRVGAMPVIIVCRMIEMLASVPK